MKLRYLLKEKFGKNSGYAVAFAALLLIVIIGGSYAAFTATSEAKGTLNIVTGDLKTFMESTDLDSDNDVVLGAKESRIIAITLKNINPVAAKYNLYYSFNKANPNVEIGYLSSGDAAPTTQGLDIEKDGSKTIKIAIKNNEEENITVNFGTSVGLTNDTLPFPANVLALSLIDFKPFTLTNDVNSDKVIDIGDEITIGNESFYVYAKDATNVKAIAKYNLEVGTNANSMNPPTEEKTLQSANALGNTGTGDPYATVSFANVDQKGTNYSDYTGSIVEKYVNDYKLKVEKLGVTLDRIGLITKDELITLGCVDSTNTCQGDNQFVYTTSYWTATAFDTTNIWYVNTQGAFNNSSYNNNNDFGIRPVINVAVSNIKLPE